MHLSSVDPDSRRCAGVQPQPGNLYSVGYASSDQMGMLMVFSWGISKLHYQK